MSDTDKYYAEIVVESSVLSEAIKSILKLATPYTGSVNFSVTKDKIVIESRAELSIIVIQLPFVSCSLSHNKITFSLVLDQLRIATTSRKGNIKLVYDNSKFIIAASRYRSELMTTDYVEYPAPVSLKDANVLKITAEQSKWLFDIINSVALKPTAISPIMPVNVHISKASTIVACYARDHIVFIKDDALTGNLDFAIPVEAFAAISQDYKFNNFKAFGHSNGGLIWTYWLEHYYSDYSDEITMKRLMTVGTPYNFSKKNINHKTQMLEDFIKCKNRLPKSLVVYSVSGGKDYESDGIVPEASGAAGKYIFQKQVKSYTAMTITGDKADHSDLPQNQQVVQIIQQYLLEPIKNNQEITRQGKKQDNDKNGQNNQN